MRGTVGAPTAIHLRFLHTLAFTIRPQAAPEPKRYFCPRPRYETPLRYRVSNMPEPAPRNIAACLKSITCDTKVDLFLGRYFHHPPLFTPHHVKTEKSIIKQREDAEESVYRSREAITSSLHILSFVPMYRKSAASPIADNRTNAAACAHANAFGPNLLHQLKKETILIFYASSARCDISCFLFHMDSYV